MDENTPDVALSEMRGAQVGGSSEVYELIDFDLGKPERDSPETRAELMEVITKCLHSYAISEEHWNDDLTTAFRNVAHTFGWSVGRTSSLRHPKATAWTNCSLISGGRWSSF